MEIKSLPFFKRLISVVVVVLLSTQPQAQITTPYTIGSIGFADQLQMVYTGPVLIDAEQCFFLSNGIKKMKSVGLALFNSTCFTATDLLGIELTGHPNPVVSDVFVQAKDAVKVLLNDKLEVKLFDASGILRAKKTIDAQALGSGFYLSMGNLISGSYFLQINTATLTIGRLKIIKTN